MKLANAFSISMVAHHVGANQGTAVKFQELSRDHVMEYLWRYGVQSYIGHADTAAVLSTVLGVEIPVNRGSLVLEKDESIFIAQYTGPRLPEGATQLPEGASFKFYGVWL